MIHASSVAVSREHRRAKTDRLDTELLKRGFLGWLRGERGHCSMSRGSITQPERSRDLDAFGAVLLRRANDSCGPAPQSALCELGETATGNQGSRPPPTWDLLLGGIVSMIRGGLVPAAIIARLPRGRAGPSQPPISAPGSSGRTP